MWHDMWHMKWHVTCDLTCDMWYYIWHVMWHITCDVKCDVKHERHVTCYMWRHLWLVTWHVTCNTTYDMQRDHWHVTWHLTYVTCDMTCHYMIVCYCKKIVSLLRACIALVFYGYQYQSGLINNPRSYSVRKCRPYTQGRIKLNIPPPLMGGNFFKRSGFLPYLLSKMGKNIAKRMGEDIQTPFNFIHPWNNLFITKWREQVNPRS